jgi:glycerol uptake operon antiterminator
MTALIPAVRDGSGLQAALALGYRRLLVERGNLLNMLGPLAAASRNGVTIFVNLDGVDGITHDSETLAFLATDLQLSGVISVKPRVLKEAVRFRLQTAQRLHALDSTGIETGLASLVSPSPDVVAIAPAIAIPYVIDRVRARTRAAIWGTGFVTRPDQVQALLSAGAAAVSSAERSVWEAFQPLAV